ncbi:hypothetical protein LXL04_023396 [Taraxacum kok-saghyz]
MLFDDDVDVEFVVFFDDSDDMVSFTPLLLKVSGFLFTGLGKIKLYCVPLSMHILLISLWRKFLRKICVEKSMKLSSVSFPGISLEDSSAIVGTNILFFSQGDRFVPQDVNLFCFFFKALVFSIYVPLHFGFVPQTFVAEYETNILKGLLMVSVFGCISS